MKISSILIISSFIIFSVSCGSDKPDKLPSSNQKKSQETANIENEIPELIEYSGLPIEKDSAEIIFTGGPENDKQFVFIDKRKKSNYYQLITAIELVSKFETTQYRDSYFKILKNHTENFGTASIENISIPKKWLELKYFESNYYVYCPAREEANFRIKISDTTIMVFGFSGVSAEKISGFEKINDKHSVINTVATTENSQLISKEINIYLINSEKQIYIWEIFAPSGITYKLMIPVDFANKFPIIINYGEKSKPEEYEFDEINYFEEISKLI